LAAASLIAVASLAIGACAGRRAAPVPADAAAVQVQVLAFNDLHGNLEPPAGGSGRVGRVPAGGTEYMATLLARLEADNPHTVVVSAGDNIGASSLLSSLFHDEPTVEALNAIGLDVSAVGNHELDEGWAELVRMQHGGCHPRDGCQDGTPFAGAAFQFLAANVQVDLARVEPDALAASGWKPAGLGRPTLFPPYAIREFGGVKVAFIGLTLRTAADLVSPAMVRGLTFGHEATAANALVEALGRQGVRAIVVLLHEGGRYPDGAPDPCAALSGEIVGIVRDLSPEVDVVVSGHTHHDYACTLGSALVTSAGSFGRMVTDIDLTLDRRTGQVVSTRARNLVVTRDVAKDAAQSAIVSRYGQLSAKEAQRPVGSIAALISRVPGDAGESPLGRVAADAFLAGGRRSQSDAVVAFINEGGLRGDLTASDGGAGTMTVGDIYRVMPFGNQLIVKTLTGDAIVRLLEEQFDNPVPGEDSVLQVSEGFTYTYRRSQPKGQRVDRASIWLNGEPLDPARRYRVVMPDFLWGGGDRFTAVAEGADPAGAGLDLDVFAAYAGAHQPLVAPATPRITRLP
jgi:5'-nucleotidase